jgi:hypothetical protein
MVFLPGPGDAPSPPGQSTQGKRAPAGKYPGYSHDAASPSEPLHSKNCMPFLADQRTNQQKGTNEMANWTQNDIHQHMKVYDKDNQTIGSVAKVYQDSFLIEKGLIFHKDRYIPYAAIATIDNDHITLNMSQDEVQQYEWKIRPDYEDHLDDPTQLFYDRGHGAQDPFDETAPDHP